MTTTPGNPNVKSAIEAGTLSEAVRGLSARYPDRIAVRTVDDAVAFDWKTLQARIDALAGGLAKLGVERGQPVALMLTNRPEFILADLAIATLGGVPFSIYQTLPPEQIVYVVADAGARVAIIEKAFVDQFMKARPDIPTLEHVIVIDDDDTPGTLPLASVEGSQPDFDAAAASRAVQGDDLMTLIYTSGTTGPPKGVQLSYDNLFSLIGPAAEIIELPEESQVISWLPTAHIAERALNYYMPLLAGATITTCPNPRDIVSYLTKVRPTFFFAVPRIWEKMKAGLEVQLSALPDDTRTRLQEGLAAAVEKVQLTQAGKPVPADLSEKAAQADAEFFAGIRQLVGLDRAIAVGVGAAPTPRNVLEFFHAIGIELGEGWGMSETCGIGTMNAPGKIKLGTVGKPLSCVEIKLAEDGEILVRGPNIMVSYRNQPEKTAETIGADGWLLTGDIGEIDPDGSVRIVDRKKELIINAAGKNMSPANIESTLKGASPLIGQVCVIGDNRPYNTALIVLDADFGPAWAAQNALADTPMAELASTPKLIAAIQAGVDAGNARLARVEQIKKFTVLAAEWMPGGTELTPTMKLKRKPIAELYAKEIEAMYA
jgi:long-subunit acyl-CoA synthetase (AMP-forming)